MVRGRVGCSGKGGVEVRGGVGCSGKGRSGMYW